MGRRRYRKKSAAGSIISDTASIGSKLSWWGALLFGLFTFILFYFIVPSWLEASLISKSENMFYPALEAIFGRRIHWFQWIGIACGFVGIYFGFRNYYLFDQAGHEERGIVVILARIFGRNLD